MSKLRVFYEEAQRLYVNDGFSLDAIVELLKNNVSRKTLFNWKTDHNWDEKRKKEIETTENFQVELKEIVRMAIDQYKAEPSAHNMFAIAKAISALKTLQGVRAAELPEQAGTKSTDIKPETIARIEHEILGL